MSEPSLNEMWKRIEKYGVKRDMWARSEPSEETIRQLYELIKEKGTKRGNEKQVRLLREYVERMKTRNKH